MQLATDDTLASEPNDVLGDLLGALDPVDRVCVEDEAGDVRGGLRRAPVDDAPRVVAVGGRLNVVAGRKDVQHLAVVGAHNLPGAGDDPVIGNLPLAGDGAHGDGVGGGGGGHVRRVLLLVAGGDDAQHALLISGLDDVVERLLGGSTQRQVQDGLVLAALGRNVVNGPLDAVQDGRGTAVAVVVQDLDGNQAGLLGDTKGLAANGASDVRAVTLAVPVLSVIGGPSRLGAALKVFVGGADARVKDVGVCVLPSGGIIDVGGGGIRLAVRNGSEAPGRRVLGCEVAPGLLGGLGGVELDVVDLVLLNVGNLFVGEIILFSNHVVLRSRGRPLALVSLGGVGVFLGSLTSSLFSIWAMVSSSKRPA